MRFYTVLVALACLAVLAVEALPSKNRHLDNKQRVAERNNATQCLNGGSYDTDSQGNLWCLCPDEYTGRYCETRFPNCSSGDECYNGGSCILKPWGYRCVCPPEYTGYQCEIKFPECNNGDECFNGGTCVAGYFGDYYCACPEGYTGYQCEREF
ncbi:delta-like protein A [Ptychodera flava]|uniref:delta-like protein A n=1 Tax=Ptychodera flava TaxID=63121 RepID=UPI00396A9D3F